MAKKYFTFLILRIKCLESTCVGVFQKNLILCSFSFPEKKVENFISSFTFIKIRTDIHWLKICIFIAFPLDNTSHWNMHRSIKWNMLTPTNGRRWPYCPTASQLSGWVNNAATFFPVFPLRQVGSTNNPDDWVAILKTRWKIGIGVCWKFELLDKQQLPGPPRQTSSCPWFPPLPPGHVGNQRTPKMQFSMRAAV